MLKFITVLVALQAFISQIQCDTPANCTYDDIRGLWTFYETTRSFDRTIECDTAGPTKTETKFQLSFPDVVTDQFGNKGRWTIIYNQGFEVHINYRKYFAFSDYVQNGSQVTSYCHRTLPGWSHDILGNNWSCFVGRKQTTGVPKVDIRPKSELLAEGHLNFQNDPNLIFKINQKQSSWKAGSYKHFEKFTNNQLHLMRGGTKSRIHGRPKPSKVTPEIKRIADSLPLEFDWRNVNSVNYVSPVRNQGGCGSCYAFSSTGMIESRLRVITNNTVAIQLSPQDVVSCSRYSQGCEGGFPFLVAGKYGQDYGFVEEKCNPYEGRDEPCHEKKCLRRYTADFDYVGGFYGACNEELMRIELVKNGPMSVSFEVYSDFQYYKGGIYHHTGLAGIRATGSKFNPFEITNHAVLLVGYGADSETGEKYWIVKNSWGKAWGENGFFRIRRGTDECGIESIAVKATPIP